MTRPTSAPRTIGEPPPSWPWREAGDRVRGPREHVEGPGARREHASAAVDQAGAGQLLRDPSLGR